MTTNKNDLAASLVACVNGLTNNYPDTQTWVFSGKTYKRGDIINMLQACMQAASKTKSDHDTWRGSVEVEKELLAQLHPVLGALKIALETEWGATSVKLAEFGFEPGKPHVKSAEGKAAGVAKARATRAAKKAALDAVKGGTAAAPGSPEAAPAAPAVPGTAAPVPPKGS